MKEIARKYSKIYGKKLDAVVGEMFKEMLANRDGDSLMLLMEHLGQASRLVKQQIESMPCVVLQDSEGKEKLM